MSIGTAIFLSSCVFAVVILYGVTKNRWPWRRIVARSALAILGIIVVTGAIVGGLSFLNRSPTLTRQTEYAGLRLVMYTKGYPPTVLEQPKAGKLGGNYFDQFDSVIETTKLPTGKRVQDYLEWQYEDNQSRIDIKFNPDRTTVVSIRCYSNDSSQARASRGMQCQQRHHSICLSQVVEQSIIPANLSS